MHRGTCGFNSSTRILSYWALKHNNMEAFVCGGMWAPLWICWLSIDNGDPFWWSIVCYMQKWGKIYSQYPNYKAILEEVGSTCLGVHMHKGWGGQTRCSSLDLSPLINIFYVQFGKNYTLGFPIGGLPPKLRSIQDHFLFFGAKITNNAWVVKCGGCTILLFIYAAPYV